MPKLYATAALAAGLSISMLAGSTNPAEAHRRHHHHHHRVVAGAVVGGGVVVGGAAVVNAGYATQGCGYQASGCAPRDCRPYGYYDMSYLYVIPSMTPTFGYRTPVRRCLF